MAEAVAQRLEQYGFLLGYSLYAHEQKLSVLHFHVTKHPAYTEPIKSKDELLFVVRSHRTPCSCVSGHTLNVTWTPASIVPLRRGSGPS